MKAFIEAFAPATMLAERVNALVKEVDAAMLLVGPNGMVLQMHSWMKFGGMPSRPNVIVGSLIGTGPRSIAVIINHGAAVASTTVTIPAATKIANCKMIRELVALANGGLATSCTITQRAATATTTTAGLAVLPQAVIPAARTPNCGWGATTMGITVGGDTSWCRQLPAFSQFSLYQPSLSTWTFKSSVKPISNADA